MIVYRLADQRYIEDREGMGAKLFGGRWNAINEACIYTSEHVSLAFLEKFVHAGAKEDMTNLALLEIEIPEDATILLKVDDQKLNNRWINNANYTQWIGGQILEDYTTLAFSVPSILVPNERNYVINPRSIHFKQVKFKKHIDFKTDYRILNFLK